MEGLSQDHKHRALVALELLLLLCQGGELTRSLTAEYSAHGQCAAAQQPCVRWHFNREQRRQLSLSEAQNQQTPPSDQDIRGTPLPDSSPQRAGRQIHSPTCCWDSSQSQPSSTPDQRIQATTEPLLQLPVARKPSQLPYAAAPT